MNPASVRGPRDFRTLGRPCSIRLARRNGPSETRFGRVDEDDEEADDFKSASNTLRGRLTGMAPESELGTKEMMHYRVKSILNFLAGAMQRTRAKSIIDTRLMLHRGFFI